VPDLRKNARAAFVLVYVGLQLALVLSADARPDRVYGFRMFNESSSLKFDLYRRVRTRRGTRLVAVRNGEWQARTKTGERLTFRWTDRIRYPALIEPGVFVHATYGLDAQLFRLQRALDDVAAHLTLDGETEALLAKVEMNRNGRAAGSRELVGERP
jgi:hypothetical protein